MSEKHTPNGTWSQNVIFWSQEKEKKEVSEEDMKGVPEFWLTIFKNVELLQEMVQEHDEAVLKSLYDITVTFNKDPMVR